MTSPKPSSCTPPLAPTNPNPLENIPHETPTREEGELSSSEEQEVLARTVEGVVDKTIPTAESTPTTTVNKYPQGDTTGKFFHASNPLSSGDFQFRSTVYSNYHNSFQKNQVPFRSSTSKRYAPPGTKDNLVIRFTDNDSGSDSEEYEQEKALEPKMYSDNIDVNRRPDSSSFSKSELLRRTTSNETKLVPNRTFISSKNKCNGVNPRGADPPISRQGSHSGNSTVVNRNLLSQECGSKQGVVLDIDKLQDLRQQIAIRETELKLKSVRQNRKTVPTSNRGYSSLSLGDDIIRKRRAASSDISQSEQEGSEKKRFKVSKPCSDELNQENQLDKSGMKSISVMKETASVKGFLQNQNKVEHDRRNKSFFGGLQSSTARGQKRDRGQKAVPSGNISIQANDGSEINATCSQSGKIIGQGGPISGLNQTAQSMERNRSDLEKMGYSEDANNRGGLSNANVLGPSNMSLQSLLAIEELQDKELEEAQEHRRRCEIEERNAFKAYRRAQRALLEANARCNHLYRQRELHSAQFQSFLVGESDLLWSSRLHEHVGNGLNPINNISGSNMDLIIPTSDHQTQLPLGNVSPPGYDSNIGNANVALRDGNNQHVERQLLGLAQCSEPDGSTSELRPQKGRNAANRVCSPSNDPIMSGDGDEELYSSDRESLETENEYQRKGESFVAREKAMNNNSVGKFPADDSQDSLLLEAHLRSKLFARLGNRTLLKNSGCVCHSVELSVEREAEDDVGSERTQTSAERLPDSIAEKSQHPDIEVDPVDNVEAHQSTRSINFLPPPVLRSAFGHIKIISPSDSIEVCSKDRQNHNSEVCNEERSGLSSEKIQQNDLAVNTILGTVEDVFFKEIGSYSCNLNVDPFWPLCMYELRGKCNDEHCCWQHVKNYQNESKKQRDDSVRAGLVQSIAQASHESLCTSLAVSRLLQVNLPANEDRGLNTRIQAHESWTRQTSYFQNGVNQTKEDMADTIQSLEKAILIFNQELDKCEGAKKALMVLSRALEVHPTSAVLWIAYLLIYYSDKNALGKDDMFFLAVENNEASYELWLLYINSRMQLDDRFVAYDNALSALCRQVSDSEKDATGTSAFILDLFLQMVDCLCMSGHEGEAIKRFRGFFPTATSNDPLSPFKTDILTCLTIPDKCILWVSCVYFVIYRKLPRVVVDLFEFGKELLELEWPSIELRVDDKQEALELMDLAAQSVDSYVNIESVRDETTRRSLHFFALSHIRCTSVLEGLERSINLLEKYIKLYPSCLELVLLHARVQKNDCFVGFEEALSKWPLEVPGIQCIWNQYAEYALENGRVEYAKELMIRWYESAWKVQYPQNRSTDAMECDNSQSSLQLASISNGDACISNSNQLDMMFGWLNLGMLRILQDDHVEAQIAIDRGLKAAPPNYYKHCVREHAKFLLVGTELNDVASVTNIANILNTYLIDPRASPVSKLLSRNFIQDIKKPRVGQIVSNMLSPISLDSSVINLVLGAWFGPSLVPLKFGKIKDLVNFAEAIMGFAPTNYQFAFSVCKFVSREFTNSDAASSGVRFWACSLLVNAIFQAIPVAPEFIWVEASSILSHQTGVDAVSKNFHDRAVSVYPFSVNLWKSNLSICEKATGNTSSIVEAARGKGINLNSCFKV